MARSGAAYVPMDPDFPKGRLEHIAADAGIGCLVNGPGTPDGITAPRVVDIAADAKTVESVRVRSRGGAVSGDDTAYVMYTSGSTGKPKGTVVPQGNVVNFFAGMDERIGTVRPDVWMLP